MTDADVDGSHIRTLLLTFFYQRMRPLITEGYLYIAQPPLYRIQSGRKVAYAFSDEERDRILASPEFRRNPQVQRYKGLGEMNPDQLWETTLNPQNRTLKRVTVEDAQLAEVLFSILMGEEKKQREAVEKLRANPQLVERLLSSLDGVRPEDARFLRESLLNGDGDRASLPRKVFIQAYARSVAELDV